MLQVIHEQLNLLHGKRTPSPSLLDTDLYQSCWISVDIPQSMRPMKDGTQASHVVADRMTPHPPLQP